MSTSLDSETLCREFARMHNTPNVRRAIAYAESGVLTWDDVAGLFGAAVVVSALIMAASAMPHEHTAACYARSGCPNNN